MESFGGLLSLGANWSSAADENSLVDRPMRLLALHDPPYVRISQLSNGTPVFEGYLVDMWEMIATQLGLQYYLVASYETNYGSVDENGTWSGLVGHLAYKRADMVLSWFQLRQDRSRVVDYLDMVPVETDQYSFYLLPSSGEIPRITPAMFNALLKPLHLHVWWALVAFLVVISVVLYLTLRCGRKRSESKLETPETSWPSCLLSSFMTLVNQAWAHTPFSVPARTVTIFSWGLGILIYANYTANLISYLTFSTVAKPIDTLQEFSERQDWVFAIEPGMGILNDWKVNRDPYVRELHRRYEEHDRTLMLNNLSDTFMSRILQPRILTYMDFSRTLKIIGAKTCPMVPLKDTLPPRQNNYFIMAQGLESTHRAINRVMQEMEQTGMVQRLRDFWGVSVDRSRCPVPSGFRELSFGELFAVLTLVPAAVVSSIVILLWEMVWFRCTALERRAKRAVKLLGSDYSLEAHQSR